MAKSLPNAFGAPNTQKRKMLELLIEIFVFGFLIVSNIIAIKLIYDIWKATRD